MNISVQGQQQGALSSMFLVTYEPCTHKKEHSEIHEVLNGPCPSLRVERWRGQECQENIQEGSFIWFGFTTCFVSRIDGEGEAP